MLESGFFLVLLVITIAELLTITPKSYAEEFKATGEIIICSVVPILVGMFISKKTFNRREKKKDRFA